MSIGWYDLSSVTSSLLIQRFIPQCQVQYFFIEVIKYCHPHPLLRQAWYSVWGTGGGGGGGGVPGSSRSVLKLLVMMRAATPAILLGTNCWLLENLGYVLCCMTSCGRLHGNAMTSLWHLLRLLLLRCTVYRTQLHAWGNCLFHRQLHKCNAGVIINAPSIGIDNFQILFNGFLVWFTKVQY
jgi:hypothetical protein